MKREKIFFAVFSSSFLSQILIWSVADYSHRSLACTAWSDYCTNASMAFKFISQVSKKQMLIPDKWQHLDSKHFISSSASKILSNISVWWRSVSPNQLTYFHAGKWSSPSVLVDIQIRTFVFFLLKHKESKWVQWSCFKYLVPRVPIAPQKLPSCHK